MSASTVERGDRSPKSVVSAAGSCRGGGAWIGRGSAEVEASGRVLVTVVVAVEMVVGGGLGARRCTAVVGAARPSNFGGRPSAAPHCRGG